MNEDTGEDLVIAAEFGDAITANLAQMALINADIESYLMDENQAAHPAGGLIDIRLTVRESDRQKARTVLAEAGYI